MVMPRASSVSCGVAAAMRLGVLTPFKQKEAREAREAREELFVSHRRKEVNMLCVVLRAYPSRDVSNTGYFDHHWGACREFEVRVLAPFA
jgi:hypothetical protein